MLEVLAFASPFVVGLYRAWRTPGMRLPSFLVVGYAYPLLLLVATSEEGFAVPGLLLPAAQANYLRIGIHLLATGVLLGFIIRGGRIRLGAPLIWASVTVAGMLVSAGLASSGSMAVARVLLTILPLLNLFLLVPSAISRGDFLRHFADIATTMALLCALISMLVIARHGYWPVWSVRLGRPFGSSVLSYLLVVGFGLSLLLKGRTIVKAGLLAACIGAASRLDTGLAVGLAAWMGLRASTGKFGALVGALGLIAGATLLFQAALHDHEDPLLAGLYRRSEFGSGRERLWSEGIDRAVTSPFIGQGDRAYLERQTRGITASEEQRVHNMPIEMAMSYGIPTAIASMMVYLSLFISVARVARSGIVPRQYATVGLWMMVAAIAHTLLTTATWMNLGDGPGILLLCFLTPLAAWRSIDRARERIGLPAQHD